MKKNKNKKIQTFNITDLYWKDSNKKEYIEILKILNVLTEEQKMAVKLFGESRYSSGYESGCDSMQDNSEDW